MDVMNSIQETMVFYKNNEYVLNAVFDSYKDNADGHDLEHIYLVLATAQKVCEYSEIEYSKEIELACLFHDCDMSNRDTHHLNSAIKFLQIAEKMIETNFLSPSEANEVCDAILRHRASGDHKPVTDTDKILAVSDKATFLGGHDITPKEAISQIVLRSVRYHAARELDAEGVIENVYTHIGEKFAEGGYAYKNVPDAFIGVFKPMWAELDSMTEDELKNLIYAHYKAVKVSIN